MKSLDSYLTPDKDIVKFIGYNSILDDIMVLVLQELGFLATVFTHDDFNDIAEFVISRSIPMKHLLIGDTIGSSKLEHTPNKLAFIQCFREVTVHNIDYILSEEKQMSYLKCVTLFTISTKTLLSVLQVKCGGFENFPRLVNLELLICDIQSIDTNLVETHVTKWMVHNARLPLNLKLSFGVYSENVDLVKKLVENWRSFSSGIHDDGRKQRLLKLSISIGDDTNDEEKVLECHTALETIICNNRDITTSSLSLGKLPSLEASDAYSGLANCSSIL
ncbi:unnamed protein product [Ambrosiozyma monospora]|uniref:Unnamed protein product n=1 Tax=Ambrosiozyma monospora TaxID=43982 RepID=A0ACB5U6N9_AMBMO|nr:unnamed protein product [Ambrosiozyma monospora]